MKGRVARDPGAGADLSLTVRTRGGNPARGHGALLSGSLLAPQVSMRPATLNLMAFMCNPS